MSFLAVFRFSNIFVDYFVPIWQIYFPNIGTMIWKVLSAILCLLKLVIRFRLCINDLLDGRSLTEGISHMYWLSIFFVLTGIGSKIKQLSWTKTINSYELLITMIEKLDEWLQLPYCCEFFVTVANLLIIIKRLYSVSVEYFSVSLPGQVSPDENI